MHPGYCISDLCFFVPLHILVLKLVDTLFLQLLSHPFIRKYENTNVDLAEYVRSVFDPTQRLKEISDVSIW